MTTCSLKTIRCGICGTESQVQVIHSTNTFGSCDLDMRPAEMMRSTMYSWVQCCPQCGYCAGNITRAWDSLKAVVEEADYRNQLTNPDNPPLANRFLCQCRLALRNGNYREAFHAALHAAWACDDSGHREQANEYRLLASECLEEADRGHSLNLGKPGSNILMLTDLLRRAGEGQRARDALANYRDRLWQAMSEELRELLAPEPIDPLIQHLLDFEAILLDRNDQDCHTVEEALTFLKVPFPE
jgi:hypothetical protein